MPWILVFALFPVCGLIQQPQCLELEVYYLVRRHLAEPGRTIVFIKWSRQGAAESLRNMQWTVLTFIGLHFGAVVSMYSVLLYY